MGVDGRDDSWLSWSAEQEASRRSLVSSARDATGAFVASLRPWQLFATLTYDPEKVARGQHLSADRAAHVSPWKAQRDARLFLRNSSLKLGRPVVGVVGIEPHKSGSMHMHGVLDLGALGVQRGDIKALHSQWFARNGFIRLEVPRSLEDVAGYCGKYLCKQLGEMVLSRELVQQRMRGALA